MTMPTRHLIEDLKLAAAVLAAVGLLILAA